MISALGPALSQRGRGRDASVSKPDRRTGRATEVGRGTGRMASGTQDAISLFSSGHTFLVDDAHKAHDGHFDLGYPEIPARVDAILASLEYAGIEVEEFHSEPRESIVALHSNPMLDYIDEFSSTIEAGRAAYPPVLPGAIRDGTGHPHSQTYCFDLSTPLTSGTPEAAVAAAGLALEGAARIESGLKLVYALCRPPGHHAGIDFFGGFCFLNNAALAADTLSKQGAVAILDLDYHHGNGTQQIFYERSDVLYVSTHADPTVAYPQISGFANEVGAGAGEGHNFNFPLPLNTDDGTFLEVLPRAVDKVSKFSPAFLVVSLGLDGAMADPVGTWSLSRESFEKSGEFVAELNLPTLVIQEGGYNLGRLGDDVVAFLAATGAA